MQVIGFSDAERYALNTLFRLSEGREPTYAAWAGVMGEPGQADVLLVDGGSAEAVLAHVREARPGQRLIWVGGAPSPQAWRVLERPISWSELLMDLDGVFAARQYDTGNLDLDVSGPDLLPPSAADRALVVGPRRPDLLELVLWLQRLGLDAAELVEDAEQALERIRAQEHALAVLDLDAPHLPAWNLAREMAASRPQLRIVGLSELVAPAADWWGRRRMRRHAQRMAMSGLLARPLQFEELRRLVVADADQAMA